jgi:hypothetical protein
MTVTEQSVNWDEVIKYYKELNKSPKWDIQPMVDFVEQIAESKYAQGLYPITSMYSLIIGQTPEIDPCRSVLKVEFFDGRFYFVYVDSGIESHCWKRDCEPDEAFSLLDEFVHQLDWFIEYRSPVVGKGAMLSL